MKKALLFFCLQLATFQLFAKLDTVTVTSHQDMTIVTNPSVGENFYPQWAEFPSGSEQYRKVLIQLKFECMPGKQCGEWDYVNNIIVGKKGGMNGNTLNYEIARLITPQGFNWNASSGWNNTWYFDVTDFGMLLHDSVQIIYRHTGYENNIDRGWKINLKFICIKGTPVAEPLEISQLWNGTFDVGNASDSIEHHLMPVYTTLNGQAGFVRFKGIHTGHGSDNAGCMEYCKKYRTLLWDGALTNQRDIWRNDCAYNAVYPQSGPWTLSRAGWCPGSTVAYDDYNISGFTGGSGHTIDMDLEPYYNSTTTLFGRLNTTAYLIQYKPATNSIDASVENIMAPTTDPQFARNNPACSNPVVVIKNNGSSAMTSATIEYGVQGGTMSTYQWTGNLSLMQTDTVTLSNPVNWSANSGKFVVNIKSVNGQNDQYTDDNMMTSDFAAPSVWPNKIVVSLMTNKDASENYFKLINNTYNQTAYYRSGYKNETQQNDTINLSPGSCYTFYFSDENASSYGNMQNKDGLDYGALNGTPNYEGAGVLKIKNAYNGSTLKDVTHLMGGPFSTKGGDFGGRYVLNFMCAFNMATPQVSKVATEVDVYPNPSVNALYVDYTTASANASMCIYDLQGKLMKAMVINKATGTEVIDISSFSPGVYTLRFIAGDEVVVKKVIKR